LTRQRWRAAIAGLAVSAFVALPALSARPARAQDPPAQPASVSTSLRYQVTLAARACTQYSQVMANRVRDDTAEAAQSPGRDSAYEDGQGVDVDTEGANGNGCSPLDGWHFTLGGGVTKKGSLSVVNGATQDVGPTAAGVAQLDQLGKPTGKTLDGAVTVVLTGDQVHAAVQRQLWVQGGTPDDPVLSQSQPGYGFGALRCGYDGRADTNVQWLGYPAEVRHLFCFAYYVRSAAPTGTLIVRAKPTRPVGFPQRFTFDATNSYAPGRQLTLSSAGESADATLVRTAGGAPSRVTAHVPDGWRLTDLSCSKSGAGTSLAVTDPVAGTADVTLADDEIVTCTYTFDPPVVTTGLGVRVFTDVGGGDFGVTVNGSGGPYQLQSHPAGDGSAAPASGPDLAGLLPGQYTISVAPPAGQSTVWSLSAVTCNGNGVKPDGLVATVQLAINQPLDCVLRLSRRTASLTLSAVTVGGTGAASFAVVRRPDPDSPAPLTTGSNVTGVGWQAAVSTAEFGTPADASGTLPDALDFGSYLITPIAPASTVDGAWRLSTFTCDPGDPAASGQAGAMVVPLGPGDGDAKCVATFQFVAATKLQVILRFGGDPGGRSGPAGLQVQCDDGSTGAVLAAGGDFTDATLPESLAFLDPTTCTVPSPDDAVAGNARASVTAALDPVPGNAPFSLPGKIDVQRDVDEYTLTVTITYHEDDQPAQQATVLRTFRILPVALIGVGLVGLGLVILLVMVVRSRGV
jgi:hypothetical protein